MKNRLSVSDRKNRLPLFEAIAAVIILIAACIGLLKIYIGADVVSKRSESMSRACIYAQTLMEDIRDFPLKDLEAGNVLIDDFGTVNINDTSNTTEMPFGTVVLKLYRDDNIPSLYRVCIIINDTNGVELITLNNAFEAGGAYEKQ